MFLQELASGKFGKPPSRHPCPHGLGIPPEQDVSQNNSVWNNFKNLPFKLPRLKIMEIGLFSR